VEADIAVEQGLHLVDLVDLLAGLLGHLFVLFAQFVIVEVELPNELFEFLELSIEFHSLLFGIHNLNKYDSYIVLLAICICPCARILFFLNGKLLILNSPPEFQYLILIALQHGLTLHLLLLQNLLLQQNGALETFDFFHQGFYTGCMPVVEDVEVADHAAHDELLPAHQLLVLLGELLDHVFVHLYVVA
jgi:hypothetical protein